MPRLDVRDAILDYDLSGDGPLVVQLHGLTSSREGDSRLGVDLARGLRRHRVLRYDARGHGASTGGGDPAAYTWPRLAEDLLDLLDHVGPDEPVHGVGPSMGAGTLLHAAVRQPHRFASLTLVIPPTAWETRRAQSAAYVDGADLVAREGVDRFVEQGREQPSPPAVDDAAEPAVPAVAEELLPVVLRGAARTDLPEPSALGDLDVPTLILGWVEDPAHPLSTGERLHDLLPSSRLVVGRTRADVATWPDLLAEHLAG